MQLWMNCEEALKEPKMIEKSNTKKELMYEENECKFFYKYLKKAEGATKKNLLKKQIEIHTF